ncbi:hypothetical protein CALCODRAFT_481370 [Calocera cornea HHB12733]|uniref:Uncharacterized protein n=1 Tax=Calocera cornea HHB12733 TaxID=1353952 RepID=A0A165HS32_9BASI|nr:hypothetical protein CALCODRAFT_481370 [Calocera cornea HHB12733]
MDCRIEPNSEIAGVGIRVSIYVQAVLAFLLASLALFKFAVESEMTGLNPSTNDLEAVDPTKDEIAFLLKSDIPLQKVIKRLQRRYLHDDQTESKELRSSRMSVQLTGVALLVSAIIQAQLYSLDIYHALLVLNLCWLNNVTALTLYLTQQFLKRPRPRFLSHPLPPRLWTIGGMKAANPFLPTSAYLCALGGYGFWLFLTINSYGHAGWDAAVCNPQVKYWILGHPISVTAPGFRITGLVIHSVAMVPLLNLIIESIILCYGAIYAVHVIFFPYRMFRRLGGHKVDLEEHIIAPKYQKVHFLRTLTALGTIYAFFVLLFILDSEEMISTNWPLIENNEENQWTFGQSLVMILLIPVLWELWDKSWEMYKLWKEKKEEDGAVEQAVLKLREETEKQEKERSNSDATTNGGGVERNDSRDSEEARVITHSQTVA